MRIFQQLFFFIGSVTCLLCFSGCVRASSEDAERVGENRLRIVLSKLDLATQETAPSSNLENVIVSLAKQDAVFSQALFKKSRGSGPIAIDIANTGWFGSNAEDRITAVLIEPMTSNGVDFCLAIRSNGQIAHLRLFSAGHETTR